MPTIVRHLSLVALGVLLGGLAVLGWSGPKWISADEEILQLRRQAMEKDLYTRARFGSYDSARCDLRRYVAFVSGMCPYLKCQDPEAVVRGLGLSYARLAVAAAKAGRAEDSQAFLDLSKKVLLQIGERPDDAQLLKYWEGIDRDWDDENARVCTSPP